MTTLWRSHIDLAQCGRSNHHTLTQSAFAQGYHDGPSTTHIYDTSLQAHPYEPDHSQPQSTHMQHGKNHTPHADGHYSEHGSNMHNANIHTASMHSANMHSANMQSANMHSVDMQSVDMQGTNMQFMNRASMRHINMPTQCGKQSPAYATPRNLPTMYPSAPSPPTHVQAPNASMYEQPSGLYGHTSEMYEQLDGMYYKQPPVLYNQSPAMQEQPLPGQDDYPYTRRQPRHGDSSCCRGDSSCCSRTHQSRSSFELPTRSQSTNRKSSFAGARRTSLSATRISLRDLSNGPSRPMWQPVQRVLPPPTSRNHWQAVAAHPDGSPTQSMQMHASPTLEDSLPRQAEASCPKQVDGTTTRPDAELPTARPCVATQPCILGKPSATTEALAPQPLGPSIPGVSLQAGATLAPAPIALKLQSSPAFTANANRTAEPSTDEKRTQLIARQMMKRLADPAAAVASLRRANPRLSEGMSDEQLLVRLYEHIASGHATEGIEKEQKMSGEKKEGHTKEVEAEEVQGRELEGRISAESGALREEEEINSATMQEEDSHGYMVSHRFTYKCWGKNLDCLVVYLAMSPRILLCHRLIDKRLCPILVKKCVDWRPPLSTTLQLKDEVETVDYLIPSVSFCGVRSIMLHHVCIRV